MEPNATAFDGAQTLTHRNVARAVASAQKTGKEKWGEIHEAHIKVEVGAYCVDGGAVQQQ